MWSLWVVEVPVFSKHTGTILRHHTAPASICGSCFFLKVCVTRFGYVCMILLSEHFIVLQFYIASVFFFFKRPSFEQTQKQFFTRRQSIQIKHFLIHHVLRRFVLNPGLKAFILTATGTLSCRQTIIHIRQ